MKTMKEMKRKDEHTPQDIVNATKADILLDTSTELQEIIESGTTKEIYFHDTVTQVVDAQTPQDRMDALQLIDHTGNEEYVDEGVLDTSSIDRFLITMAYECLHQEIFDDDFIQNLQSELNNESVDKENAIRILTSINDVLSNNPELKEIRHIDSATQIWVTLKKFGKHLEPKSMEGFAGTQITGLSGAIKIHTSNKKVNQNAIVIEGKGDEKRIYLMDKDKDVDIRNFFKYSLSIKENNYSLKASDYTDGKIRKTIDSLKRFNIVIHKMASELTERSIEQMTKEKMITEKEETK